MRMDLNASCSAELVCRAYPFGRAGLLGAIPGAGAASPAAPSGSGAAGSTGSSSSSPGGAQPILGGLLTANTDIASVLSSAISFGSGPSIAEARQAVEASAAAAGAATSNGGSASANSGSGASTGSG